MLTVILVAHILVSIVLVAVVLMQRSEGGALGIGGGGGGGPGGGLMSGSGAKGALIRTTIIFGAIFFATSLVLTTISTSRDSDGRTAIEQGLQEEFAPDPVDDDLGIGDLETLTRPSSDMVIEDPLAADQAPSTSESETEADQPAGGDPLGEPR